jgi:sulfatase maturation enzyme AslB (radical SAM superfamily)
MWREIKVLHLESTDVCQAACPACARESDPLFDKSQHHHLSIDMIQRVIPAASIRLLDKMYMCGNYGDPAAGKHTMEIYRYFREINPDIVLGMNSNGAIQNTAWWQALGELFHRQQDYVVFSIDGLEDTNHVYRRGVNWNKLIENAQAYISTGASAHWDMLVYRHNEHQVDACERLARDMGFTWFRAKVSKREMTNGLELPINWIAPMKYNKSIDCHALDEQSLYIDAQGRQSPCCWLGSRQQDFVADIDEVMMTWQTDRPHPVCVSACGTDSGQSNFSAQWQRQVQLCQDGIVGKTIS